ncbi:DUF3592 domain-containing protein [Streptomyces sp. MUSC 14]|uniref:DUF3592 domain-containing protein n=1 Tax=Streptomyces sp. MUSC 14 TaxID=1354889 RepID=UPI001160D1E6|nr:DUF3592 domain-containing protein [Streptomyces sp. MUSC 14]
MQRDSRIWAVGRTVAMAVMTLVGLGILVADVRDIAQADSHISDLRAHGRRVPGSAALGYSCSSGRGGGCSVSSVQLIFRAADGDDVYVPEDELAESLYVPSGRPSGAEDLVPTTVVYDPADPEDAQAAGALHWGVVDLIAHHWLSFALGVVLTGVGAAALVIDRV